MTRLLPYLLHDLLCECGMRILGTHNTHNNSWQFRKVSVSSWQEREFIYFWRETLTMAALFASNRYVGLLLGKYQPLDSSNP